MEKVTRQDLEESIEELISYRDRLKQEVISISQKLQMPPNKITSIIAQNSELMQIDQILSNLVEQRDNENT